MEYAQPFAGPVLLVYAILGAIVAFARLKVEGGAWAEVHTAERTGPFPSEESYAVKAALGDRGIPCKLRTTHAQLSTGETQPVTVAAVRPSQVEEAHRVIHEMDSQAG